MTTPRTRAHLAWLGILLVLMPLLAPAISHAIVRAQGGDARHAAWVAGLDARGWCSPPAADTVAAEARATDIAAPADVPAPHLAAACDYCGWPLGLAAVAALPSVWSAATLPTDALQVGVDRRAPAAPRSAAHGARAPPSPIDRQA
ncbi:DUF2946 family protein [Leptothrix discophora]|uniref:DUF2946 family protein n=1 Tax=Leptothrix discophora TaxID=89 RepID=A0ABT9FYY8_LEPDI|nr:DUF2946 family protein [Leptothrix discophora]MDP4299452.1 DUF2946 family protein [Leptothrix discophora]